MKHPNRKTKVGFVAKMTAIRAHMDNFSATDMDKLRAAEPCGFKHRFAIIYSAIGQDDQMRVVCFQHVQIPQLTSTLEGALESHVKALAFHGNAVLIDLNVLLARIPKRCIVAGKAFEAVVKKKTRRRKR